MKDKYLINKMKRRYSCKINEACTGEGQKSDFLCNR